MLARKALILVMACVVVSFAVINAKAEGPVKIISPFNGDKYLPGDEVNVKVEAPENSLVLMAAGPYFSTLLDHSPYELKFTIPQDVALGKLGIIAGGKNAKGEFIGSAEVDIMVGSASDTKDTITSIKIYPTMDPLRLPYLPTEAARKNVMVPLTVHATFADGVERDITSTESGTKYSSSDESVFIIDFSGLGVRPVNIGEAFLTVTHEPVSKKIKIIVEKQG